MGNSTWCFILQTPKENHKSRIRLSLHGKEYLRSVADVEDVSDSEHLFGELRQPEDRGVVVLLAHAFYRVGAALQMPVITCTKNYNLRKCDIIHFSIQVASMRLASHIINVNFVNEHSHQILKQPSRTYFFSNFKDKSVLLK